MTHIMHLKKKPYNSIYNGEKTIELRLYDEKRKQIKQGDELVFVPCNGANGTITAIVAKLHLFDNFKALYASLPLEKCGYSKSELDAASHKDMELYYSAAQQSLYGVVGIEFVVTNRTV